MIWAGLLLGLFSGLHCIAMCGPIALAIPVKPGRSRIVSILMYNLGRIFTYSLFGVAAGTIGKGLAMAGFQQYLSVFAGICVLLFVLQKFIPGLSFTGPGLTSGIRKQFSRLFSSTAAANLFLIGILNGLLPCGMVYVALAGAVSTGSVSAGILFMAAFGAGTFPLMFSVSWLRTLIGTHWKIRFQKVAPLFLAATAIVMILRGLNLGIPYVSPEKTAKQEVSCCHKKEVIIINSNSSD